MPFGQEEIRDRSSTPVLLNLMPAGRYVMADLYEKADGLPPLACYMVDSGLLDGDAHAVSGQTLGELLREVSAPELGDPEEVVIRPLEAPVKARSSLVIVKGHHAAVVSSNSTLSSEFSMGWRGSLIVKSRRLWQFWRAILSMAT